MIPAVIVCHGELGEALIRAVAGIYGDSSGIQAISNAGLSGEALSERVMLALEGLDGPVILLTDYFGGSCANACLAELGRKHDASLISGVNLPILLYYLAHREEMGVRELIAGMIDRGKGSVRELGPPAGNG